MELVAVIKEEQTSRLHCKIYFGYKNVECDKITFSYFKHLT